MLRRADRVGRGDRRGVPPSEHDRRRRAAALSRRARRLPHGRGPGPRTAGAARRFLSFAPGSSGAAVSTRSRAGVAESDVRYRGGQRGHARRPEVVAAARGSLRVRGDLTDMAHRVLIPTPLRPYTNQQDTVEIEGATVGELLSALTSRYSDLRRHLYSDEGKLRSFVNVYVNDDDIRYLDREATTLKERSEEHTSELQSQSNLVCRLLLEKKNKK